jgi:hypothetical protein
MRLVHAKCGVRDDHSDGGDDHKMIKVLNLEKKKVKNKTQWRLRQWYCLEF